MIKPYECTQCGSTDFNDAGTRRVRCAHCGSLFEVLTDEPTLTINKGANVVFGKNANVKIRGDIEIQSGANVDLQGKVVVVKGNKKQEFKLNLIQRGDESPKSA
jgi:uncharacterized Zn finger protein